jgi:hypothetical protein
MIVGAQQQPVQPVPPERAAATAPDPRRDDIRMMESVLTQALQKGAADLARQLRVSEPNSAFVTGTGRARGFILEGYGIFFDVDVPGMKQSVVWSAQMLNLAQEKEAMLQKLASLSPDDPMRRIAVENIRRIDRFMNAVQGGAVLIPTVPNAVAPAQLASPDRVSAANVQPIAEGVASAASPAAPAAPVPLAAPNAEVKDPNVLYTESGKGALIDAMLRYSGFLKIADQEWLAVAASDSEGPQVPGQLDDASRILIRIKGSDLSAYQTNKISREEVLKRVEVREY